MTITLPLVGVAERDGVRHLQLGTDPNAGYVQGSMRVKQPLFIEHEYVRRLLAGLMWLDLERLHEGHAVQLGLGAGAVTRFTRHCLGMATTAVEINPHVIEACRRFFGIQPDPRLQVIEADAGPWLRERCPKGRVKMLFVDMYDDVVAKPVFDDEAFYADCHAVLQEGGLMAMNLFGAQSDLQGTLGRIASVFGADAVWTLEPTAESHVAVIATRGLQLPPQDQWRAKALAINLRFLTLGLRAGSWPQLMRPYRP
jgi:spermidine synthase